MVAHEDAKESGNELNDDKESSPVLYFVSIILFIVFALLGVIFYALHVNRKVPFTL